MSYDPKCYELAKLFLLDSSKAVNTEAHRDRLAQIIQDNIEQELQEWEEEAAIECRKTAGEVFYDPTTT